MRAIDTRLGNLELAAFILPLTAAGYCLLSGFLPLNIFFIQVLFVATAGAISGLQVAWALFCRRWLASMAISYPDEGNASAKRRAIKRGKKSRFFLHATFFGINGFLLTTLIQLDLSQETLWILFLVWLFTGIVAIRVWAWPWRNIY